MPEQIEQNYIFLAIIFNFNQRWRKACFIYDGRLIGIISWIGSLPLTRAGPRHVGVRCNLIIWRHLNSMFFKVYQPMTGLTNVSEGTCPNCKPFSQKFVRVQKPDFTITTFLIISETYQHSGQLLDWPVPQSGPVSSYIQCKPLTYARIKIITRASLRGHGAEGLHRVPTFCVCLRRR